MSRDLLGCLPLLRQEAEAFCALAGGKMLVVAAAGFEGDAAVAAVALRMQLEGCSCYQALTELLHLNAAPLVSSPHNWNPVAVLE